MATGKTNTALGLAKADKNDEFYTLLEDIETEMVYYRDQFQGKTIFLNCDDPEESNFWKYFSLNFDFLGLKGLISTHYVYENEEGPAYMLRYDAQAGTNNEKVTKKLLSGDGDFRSKECLELLEEADIVITNPPFSLWREYLATLVEYEKQFIILGNLNAVTYQDVFPLIKNNKLWWGVSRNGSGSMWFRVPKDAPDKTGQKIDEKGNRYQTIGTTCWYTNMEHKQRHEELILTKFYESNEKDYPYYDNYNAIEVSRVVNIPMDYEGAMGVPITFLGKYNPDQFEIIGATESEGKGFSSGLWDSDSKFAQSVVDGKRKYKRLFIKNKNPITKQEILGL